MIVSWHCFVLQTPEADILGINSADEPIPDNRSVIAEFICL